MFTVKKINVFLKYNGDSDLFVKHMNQIVDILSETAPERDMAEVDFRYLNDVFYCIKLFKQDLLNNDYGRQLIESYKSNMDSDAFGLIWNLADSFEN
jgi:hypothetical protein